MDKVQGFAFLIVVCFYMYTSIKQSMHMYQQNRYQIGRYITWLQDELHVSYIRVLKMMGCLMGLYGLYFVSKEDVPAVLLLLLLLIYAYVLYKMEDMKEYRKPLVYTSRVQRLLCASYVFYMVLCCTLGSLISLETWIFILPFLYMSPWVFIVIVAICMRPIEERIKAYYVQDAKKIISAHSSLRIIAITGSYGKTSVKTILHELLADTYYTLMTPKSYNNQMGITLTIRRELQALHELFLCEMGADHVHEIRQLMDFVQPRIGVVTAVGPQHIQTFHTMGNILHEKMQVIEKLPSNGVGFINVDNAYIRNYEIHNVCRIIRFGIHETAEYQAMDIQYNKEGTSFYIQYENERYAFTTRLLGEHNVLNITCAVAVAHTQGMEWGILQRLVNGLPFVEHRLQLRESARYTILDNAYNSNPEGARYALDVLSQMEGKKVIVTPGFIDLGDEGIRAHRAFGEQIAQCVDIAILVGEHQSKDIVHGLRTKNFPLSKLYVVNGIEEAFTILESVADKETTVLLENDLPDAFNH